MYKDITKNHELRLTKNLRQKAKKYNVELQYNNGKPESGAMPGIENVNNSMELDSGRLAVWADGRINGLGFEADVRVCGDVRVVFRDEVYKCASQMPAELLKAYHDGTDGTEAALSDGKEYETPYFCDNNNWFEENLKIYDKDRSLCEKNTVVDKSCDMETLIKDLINLYEEEESHCQKRSEKQPTPESATTFGEIRELYKNGQLRYQTIARRFGISGRKAKLLLGRPEVDFPVSEAANRIPELLKEIRRTIRKAKRKSEFYFDDIPEYILPEENSFYGRRSRDYSSKEKARNKNRKLVDSYESFKEYCCDGLGQRRLKLFLTGLAKKGDDKAALFRSVLEIESVNVNAKKYRNTSNCAYQDNLYNKKGELLDAFIRQCQQYGAEHPDTPAVVGYEDADGFLTDQIVYFELPDTEQISFHCNLTDGQREAIGKYGKPWDGKVNSTLYKIEDAVMRSYATEIAKYRRRFENQQ